MWICTLWIYSLSTLENTDENKIYFVCSPQAFWLSSAPGVLSTLVTSVILYSLTRATLMSPGHDETRVCGYIYIYMYMYTFIYTNIIYIFVYIYIYVFSLFFSRTFTMHRTAGEGGGYLFNISLPLPLTSQTLRH